MTIYANRGKVLENLIIASNRQYKLKKIAAIQKVEQPVRVSKKHPGGKVTGQLLQSTVDFIGHYRGRGVAFDAKETQNKTSFPLSNLEQHQYNFLEDYHDSGGMAFLVISFTKLNKFYLLPFPLLREYWQRAEDGGPKSIKLIDFTIPVKTGRGAALDYSAPLEKSFE